jgi:hypothetical protein
MRIAPILGEQPALLPMHIQIALLDSLRRGGRTGTTRPASASCF